MLLQGCILLQLLQVHAIIIDKCSVEESLTRIFTKPGLWTGLDSQLFETSRWTHRALINAFLSDFGYLANQTLLLAHQ